MPSAARWGHRIRDEREDEADTKRLSDNAPDPGNGLMFIGPPAMP